MSDKEIEILLNYNFRDYLKSRLDEHDMTLRELSNQTRLSYGILSKITFAKSKSRNVKYQEFLIILDVLGEDIDDFLDYVLKRPRRLSDLRRFIRQLDPEGLVLLSNLLNQLHPDNVNRFLRMMNEIAYLFSNAEQAISNQDIRNQAVRNKVKSVK